MRQRGFTLAELSIVLIIMSLIGGIFLPMMFSVMDGQRAVTTRAKLAAIDAALVSFVAVNRRLPCPADGRLNAGTETSPCTNLYGVVPWVALGLSAQDIEDGWGNRITYRVDTKLTAPDAMNMSACDPAGRNIPQLAAPYVTCTPSSGVCSSLTLENCVKPQSFLAGKGIEVKDSVSGQTIMNPAADPATGAAYVLISHGENQAGAYNNSGALMGSVKDGTGANEAHNSAALAQSYYVDKPQIFSSDGTRFDDFVLRPSVISVAQRAHLGPRSHQ